MKYSNFSLRTRIFIAMIFLVVIASVLIAAITIYQYNEQAEDYHNKRLERKEEAIKSAITYELNRDTIHTLETKFLPRILDKKLNEISDIHNLDINIYDLKGKLLRSSHVKYTYDTVNANLSKNIIDKISESSDHRLVLPKTSESGNKFKSSFTYLINANLLYFLLFSSALNNKFELYFWILHIFNSFGIVKIKIFSRFQYLKLIK